MKMRKSFYISGVIFGVTLFLLVFNNYTQEFLDPNDIASFPGFRELVSALDRISGIDAVISFFSGLSTIVSGALKRYFE